MLIRVPPVVVFSSVAARVTVAPFVIVGASLTGVTVIDADADWLENAVVPPPIFVCTQAFIFSWPMAGGMFEFQPSTPMARVYFGTFLTQVQIIDAFT